MVELDFHPEFPEYLKGLKINPLLFEQITGKIKVAVTDLDAHTSRIRGLPTQFRKLKFRAYRIILWKGKGAICVIFIFHRRQGYTKESLRKLLKLVRDYTG